MLCAYSIINEVAADIIDECKAALRRASTPISSAADIMESSAGTIPVIIFD